MTKTYRISRAFKKEMLKVSSIHSIYVEQSGNPSGIPVIHVHGGPGSRSKRSYRKFYNPEKYRIIIFDQRGCGNSTPLGELRENTTQDLISDMEKIRTHLGIGKWVVSGGSWGSTLAVYYAETYPQNVLALIVRGIFMARKKEIDWIYKNGANMFYPDVFERFINYIPAEEREDILEAYAKRILGNDEKVSIEAAKIAGKLEDGIMFLNPKTQVEKDEELDKYEYAGTRIFFHYEKNNSFLSEGELIRNANKLKDIPGVIIQGRYDMVCPPITAWELHKVWQNADFYLTFGGHHSGQKETLKKIIEYTDKYSQILG